MAYRAREKVDKSRIRNNYFAFILTVRKIPGYDSRPACIALTYKGEAIWNFIRTVDKRQGFECSHFAPFRLRRCIVHSVLARSPRPPHIKPILLHF